MRLQSLFLILFILVACNLKKKAPTDIVTADHQLLKEQDIKIYKSPSRDTAFLQFTTRAPAKCEIRVWNQDNQKLPKQDLPSLFPCNTQIRTRFSQKIENLDPASQYHYGIKIWSESSNKDAGFQFITSDRSIDQKASIEESQPVARISLNIPDRNAEIGVKLNDNSENSLVAPGLGCKNGPLRLNNTHTKYAQKMFLEKFRFSGYTTGQATYHPFHPYILKAKISSPQPTKNWTFSYNNNKTVELSPTPYMQSIETKSSNRVQLPQNPVYNLPANLNSEKKEAIEFNWKNSNPDIASTFIARIGHSQDNLGLSCFFDGRSGYGKIESQWLANFKTGSYPVTVILESSVKKDVSSGISWQLHTYDWRYFILNLKS